MGNVVETVFASKDDITKTIDGITARLPIIERMSRPAGEALDRAFSAGSSGARRLSSDVDTLTNKIDAAAKAARQLTLEQSRFKNASDPTTGGFDLLGSLPGRSGLGSARGRFVNPTDQLDLSRATKEARDFDIQLQRISQTTDKATNSQQKFHGVTLIGSTILRQFGIEGARGIEVVSNQILQLVEQGKSLKEILSIVNDSKLLGFTALAASAIALFKVIQNISEEYKKLGDSALRTQEQLSRVSYLGRQGGTSQGEADLKKLEETRRDIDLLNSIGERKRAEEVARVNIGGGATQQEIDRLQNAYDKLYASRVRFEKTDFLGGLAFTKKSAQYLFQSDQASVSEIQKAFDDLVKAQGGNASTAVQNSLEANARRVFDRSQIQLYEQGDKSNIFDRARESLRSLAQETGRTKELDAFIQKLVELGKQGELGIRQSENAIERFKKGLEFGIERAKQFADLNKLIEKQFDQIAKNEGIGQSLKQFDSANISTRKQLETNPFTLAVEDFQQRADQINKQYRDTQKTIDASIQATIQAQGESDRKRQALGVLGTATPHELTEDAARKRQLGFLDQQKKTLEETTQEANRLNAELLRFANFKLSLSLKSQVSDTITQIDTLGIIGGRGRQQQIGQEKTGFLNSQFDNQLEVSRLLGRNIDNAEALWRRVQTITENLTGRTAAEAIEAATRGLSPEQLDAAGVRNARIGALQDVGRFQEEDFRRQQRIRQIEDESRDRLLGASQAAYGQARTPEEKRIAIEAGLNAVRDSSSLSPSQVEAKARLLDQSLSIQLDVLRQQQARESRLEASQDKFTTALEKFAEKFGTSVGILGTATEQIKDGINLNVVTDSPSETKVDLGQGFISTGVNAPINNAGFFDPTPSRSNNY